ncbi:hypothetical protein KIN20_037378 [Parelaphostrongylus tenuis]|uniref:FBD domain-containing protein n=1 Tax=Parelaphostrongylus tenuis TaxID=148309 RepID=A0AAD5WM01_PARTN|nr:hypothetical protein KIN20_037378 [Parelaphostrongylus tenuis]
MADWSMMFGEALKKVIAPKRQPSLFYCLFIKIYSQRLRKIIEIFLRNAICLETIEMYATVPRKE